MGLFTSVLFARGKGDISTFPVKSWRSVNPRRFNGSIVRAARQGGRWVQNPLLIAVRYLGNPNVGYIRITRKDNRPVAPTRSTVTVFLGDFLDDAVAGSWTEFIMRKSVHSRTWRLTRIRMAFLGNRINSPRAFLKGPLP